MNIRRYKAKSMKEAILLVKEELGEDAAILSTRNIGDKVEILAAKDVDMVTGHGPQVTGKNPETCDLRHETSIEHDLEEVKQGMRHLFGLIQYAPPNGKQSSPMYTQLVSSGVHPLNALKITSELDSCRENHQELSNEEIPASIRDELKTKLSLYIKTAPIHLEKKPVIVSFIGPTGVGKTTTIAKLASNFTIYDKLKVSLITIDTYRIAAVEQLKTFADIINIPLDVVMSPDEFAFSIDEHRDSDVIFIDTAGRSQRNGKHMKELSSFFRTVRPDEIHLVLSTTTKSEDMLDIVEKFEIVSPDKLIFTKLDETTKFGGILDTTVVSSKPVSYLTTGQNVPDDIERAEPMRIAEYILGTKND